MLSSNIFIARKLLRRGGTVEVSSRKENDLKPLLEEKLHPQNSRGKLQNKSQEKKVPKKRFLPFFPPPI